VPTLIAMRSTLTIAVAAVIAALAPAVAIAKDGDVERRGSCSGASSAKIKLSPDDGRLEAEFEVDQNRRGVTWSVRIRRNGDLAVRANATTRGRSGSFSVERRITDGPGADTVVARAVSPSGEVCTARATI